MSPDILRFLLLLLFLLLPGGVVAVVAVVAVVVVVVVVAVAVVVARMRWMVHITLDGYTGAAERRPRRDARLLHTGTTLFRSVPLSRLSPSSLPTHLFHHLATTLPSLSRPPPLSALVALLLCPSPSRFTLSLYTDEHVSLFLFLPLVSSFPFSQRDCSHQLLPSPSSTLDVLRPSRHPLGRSLPSSFLLSVLLNFSLLVLVVVVVPLSLQREHSGSCLPSRSTPYIPPCCSLVFANIALYPTSTLTVPYWFLPFPLVSTSCSFSTPLLSLSLPLFRCSSLSLVSLAPPPFSSRPAKKPPLPPLAPLPLFAPIFVLSLTTTIYTLLSSSFLSKFLPILGTRWWW